jgi:hypothetical protein
MKESKMNTKVAVIVAECNSIISLTETVNEMITKQDLNTFDVNELEIDTIRTTAEEMLQLVVDFQNDYFSVTKEELEEQSITLYQDCKYILQAIEDEYEFLMSAELSSKFDSIRLAVDVIRTYVQK